MAAENTAESLQEEISCPICLDYFTDPVSIDCGHSFCRSCITRTWEGIETNFPCPQCRETSQQRNLRPSRHLANITKLLKNQGEKEENLCEKHEEKLKLFCTWDQRPICVVCDRSQDHRYHTVIPIEEAAQEYKVKYEIYMNPLKKKLKEILEFKSSEERKTEELKLKIDLKRKKILAEFEELHQFLNEEQRIRLSRLEEEEKEILKKIRDNVTQLEDQSFSLEKLISEIEEKSQQSATELLKDAKATLSRCRAMEFPKPEAVSVEEGKCSHPDFLFILKHGVNVTLDPETAHPKLILSEDRKSVKCTETNYALPKNPQRFESFTFVLGCESFTSGRHYWEVEVGDMTGWELGVCKDSVNRKEGITLLPENGYWAVTLCNINEYVARTFLRTLLPLSVKPRAVGILLDYEAGKVSFYNADNKSHLFTFTDTFTEKLRPFFSPCYGGVNRYDGILRVRPAPDWK